MNRRQFLHTVGAGAVLGSRTMGKGIPAHDARQRSKSRPALKNWAWMRGGIKSMDDWRRKLAEMRAAGINAILISGSADFYRTAIPVVRQEGLEIHAWIFTMMRGEHVKTHPEWYAVSRKGVSTAEKPPYVDYYRFMCPARDDVRQFLVGYVRELAEIGGLASVHLDYIRYPDVILPVALWPKYNLVQDKEYPEFDFCYCRVCRDRFKRQAGTDPLELQDPPSHRAWLQYRYDTITEVVGLLANEVHAHKKQVTAAVFPTPTIARTLVRQDWVRWQVDAVLPMVYHAFYKEDVAWIERATRLGVDALGSRIPLYTGLYVPDLTPPDLGRAVERALAGGAQGVSLFQGNTLTPAHWEEFSAAVKRAGAEGGR
ncbi:MAG: hypothetical protein LAP85_16665 [Acidobacteriia bacterium]|nr:hypothetical protein [Terriglobia bacterium]